MGGCNSGRPPGHFKYYTTTSYRMLDIRKLQRKNLLLPNLSFQWLWLNDGKIVSSINVLTEHNYIVLSYPVQCTDGVLDFKHSITLTKTPCHLGGERLWFQCPCCRRRVAILYRGTTFACRQCHKLVYPSQRMSSLFRALHSTEQIGDRMGWDGAALNGYSTKPKGMHWRTYKKLCNKHDFFKEQMLREARWRFGRVF